MPEDKREIKEVKTKCRCRNCGAIFYKDVEIEYNNWAIAISGCVDQPIFHQYCVTEQTDDDLSEEDYTPMGVADVIEVQIFWEDEKELE